MKQIKLSQQGKYKNLYSALVDDEDFEELNKHSWNVRLSKKRKSVYAQRSVIIDGKNKNIKMHWVVLGCKGGDHIDRNGLNNQRLNLRKSTTQQNTMNSGPRKNGSAIYKGVRCFTHIKKWQARITHFNKEINLGLYNTIEEAAKAYDKKAFELFGEFAYLNFKNETL